MLEKRLKVLRKFHKSCVSQLSRNALVPSSADLFMHPLVRGLIEDTPNDGSKFTIAHLDPVKDSFLEISRQWVDEVKSKLFSMVQSSLHSDGKSEEQPDQRDIDTILNLATTFFHCSGCSRNYYRDSHETSFRYKRAIIHFCAGEWSSQTECPEPLETLRENLKKLPWNTSNNISFNSRAHRTMRDIVALCGFDPDTTTAQEMNVIDPIFECVTCNSPSNGRCTMTWECIVSCPEFVLIFVAEFHRHRSNTIVPTDHTESQLKLGTLPRQILFFSTKEKPAWFDNEWARSLQEKEQEMDTRGSIARYVGLQEILLIWWMQGNSPFLSPEIF